MNWYVAAYPIVINIATFMGFFICATIHHYVVHKRHPTAAENAWHGFLAGVLSPATMDSTKDFIVHLVVYSGYVIPPH